MSKRGANLGLVALLLLSFGLRIFESGRGGLRLDEAGQAWAATQPTLGEMLVIERTHAMALPLDYLVTRAMAALSDAELVLRLPSAVWATLNVALLYALARVVTGRRLDAFLAAFLLAFSPLHIYFAQVLRFYAALSACYALSSLTLYRAIRRPTPRRWLAWGIATLAGAYFHPFVLTSVAGGAVYYLLAGPLRPANRAGLRRFVVSAALVGLLFLPGFLVFGGREQYAFDPFEWSQSLDRVILSGLDWTNAFFDATWTAARVWAWANAAFAALGLIILWRRPDRVTPFSLVIGALLSIGLIVAAVLLRGYWLLPRQLLHLTQVGIILAAIGVAGSVEALTGRLHAARRPVAQVVLVGALAILAVAAAGTQLRPYYATPWSTGREAALALLEHHSGDAPAYVIPGYELQSFQYYLDRPEVADRGIRLRPVTLEELAAELAQEYPEVVFLAVLSPGTPDALVPYTDLGFTTVYDDTTTPGRRYMLLARGLDGP